MRFAVDGRHLLARPQIGDGVVPFFRSHTISDAATGPTAVEAEHQTRPLGRPAMDEGIDAKGPMRAKEPRLDPLHEGKIRPPHQRAVGEHPEIFGSVRGIRIHGCDIEEYAASAQAGYTSRYQPRSAMKMTLKRRNRRLGEGAAGEVPAVPLSAGSGAP